ncbi:MAG: hypothetical protein WDN01_03320 [Rhizomicrobium sp.]
MTVMPFEAHVPQRVYLDNEPLARLHTSELLLVTTLRLFAAAHCHPDSGIDWRGGLAASGAGCCAVPAFDALFGIVAATARRSLDVRCRHCPSLSHDEGRLLQLVSLLQHGRAWEARDVLAGWLAPAAVRLAVFPAKGLAAALARADLVVPLRHRMTGAAGRRAEPTHRGSIMVH